VRTISIASVAVVLVLVCGVAASAAYVFGVESATVRIATHAWTLDSWVTLHGAPTGGQFQTGRVKASLTETATGTATGTARSAGRYATGYVVFAYICPAGGAGCKPPPIGPDYPVCRVPDPSNGVLCYATQVIVTCFCGERVPVRARAPGAAFNVPANALNGVTGNTAIGAISVRNPAPISGGSDGVAVTVVTQTDINSAAAALTTRLRTDLQAALPRATSGQHVVPDGSAPVTVSTSVAAGARASTFEVTATGTLGGTTFRDADVQPLIAESLNHFVPAGFRLRAAPSVSEYRVEDSDQRGNVTVSGKVEGDLVSIFSVDSLRVELRGQDLGVARAIVEAAAPESKVDIRTTPLGLPWLPMNAARISIVVIAASA